MASVSQYQRRKGYEVPFDLRWEDFRQLAIGFAVLSLIAAAVLSFYSLADGAYVAANAGLVLIFGAALVYQSKRRPYTFLVVPILTVLLIACFYAVRQMHTSEAATDWIPLPMLLLAVLLVTNLVYQILARLGSRRHYYRGVLAMYKGRMQEAVDVLSTFIRDHPRDADAHYIRAAAFSNLGSNEQALDDIEISVANGGMRLWQYLAVRGWVLGVLGDPADGLRHAETADRLGANPGTRAALANNYLLLRRFDEALEAVSSPSTRKQPLARHLAAESHRLSGNASEAVKEFAHVEKLARRCNKRMLPFEGMQAYAHAMLLENDDALASAEIALARNEADYLALRAIAVCRLRAAEKDGALEALRVLGERQPYLTAQAMDDPLFASVSDDAEFQALRADCLRRSEQEVEYLHERHPQVVNANGA